MKNSQAAHKIKKQKYKRKYNFFNFLIQIKNNEESNSEKLDI